MTNKIPDNVFCSGESSSSIIRRCSLAWNCQRYTDDVDIILDYPFMKEAPHNTTLEKDSECIHYRPITRDVDEDDDIWFDEDDDDGYSSVEEVLLHELDEGNDKDGKPIDKSKLKFLKEQKKFK